jgi:hypothetical protein
MSGYPAHVPQDAIHFFTTDEAWLDAQVFETRSAAPHNQCIA